MTVIKVWTQIFSTLWFALTVVLLIIFARLSICHLHIAIAYLRVLKLLPLTHIWDGSYRRLMSFWGDGGSGWLPPRRADTPLVLIHIVQTVLIVENSGRILSSVHSRVSRGCLRATRPQSLGIPYNDTVWIYLIFHLLSVIIMLIHNFTRSFVIKSFLLENLSDRHIILLNLGASFLSFLRYNFYRFRACWLIGVVWILIRPTVIKNFTIWYHLIDWVFTTVGLNASCSQSEILTELVLAILLIDIWMLN